MAVNVCRWDRAAERQEQQGWTVFVEGDGEQRDVNAGTASSRV